jgi:phasin
MLALAILVVIACRAIVTPNGALVADFIKMNAGLRTRRVRVFGKVNARKRAGPSRKMSARPALIFGLVRQGGRWYCRHRSRSPCPALPAPGRTELRRRRENVIKLDDNTGEAKMMEPKLEVPAELRELVEKTIDQTEKAFGMFFDAANKSVASMPTPGTEISKQALSFTEQNLKAAFEHARKLVHATDLQQAMQIQSEFLRSQFTNAGEHMQQITGKVMSAAKDASKL